MRLVVKVGTSLTPLAGAAIAIADGRHAHASPWALERKSGTYFPPQKRKSSDGH